MVVVQEHLARLVLAVVAAALVPLDHEWKVLALLGLLLARSSFVCRDILVEADHRERTDLLLKLLDNLLLL